MWDESYEYAALQEEPQKIRRWTVLVSVNTDTSKDWAVIIIFKHMFLIVAKFYIPVTILCHKRFFVRSNHF